VKKAVDAFPGTIGEQRRARSDPLLEGRLYHVRPKAPLLGSEYVGLLLKVNAPLYPDRESLRFLLVASSFNGPAPSDLWATNGHTTEDSRELGRLGKIIEAEEITPDQLPTFLHWPRIYPAMDTILKGQWTIELNIEHLYLTRRPR